MEKTDIRKLYEKTTNPGSENIGPTNVNNRLTTRCGEGVGLRILSKKEVDTCISSCIPGEGLQYCVRRKYEDTHQTFKSPIIFQDMLNKI